MVQQTQGKLLRKISYMAVFITETESTFYRRVT